MQRLLLIKYLILLFLLGCRNEPPTKFIIPGYEPEKKPIRISISDLAFDYRLYDGKYVETSGFFSNGFEDFAIYTDKRSRSESNKAFWLNINSRLKVSYESLEKINGKKITIRGVVDISDKGHLGSYVATIKNIYHISYK